MLALVIVLGAMALGLATFRVLLAIFCLTVSLD